MIRDCSSCMFQDLFLITNEIFKPQKGDPHCCGIFGMSSCSDAFRKYCHGNLYKNVNCVSDDPKKYVQLTLNF